MEKTPAADRRDSVIASRFSDEVILDAWLSSDPAPGSYSQYRKDYFALQRGKL